MSSQDRLEKVLRDIHVLISKSEAYNKDKIIVNKQDMFSLIDRLNASIYEVMDEYELTRQSRDKAEREAKKQGDKIIWDASRKAEDIYAASVMYTDEALNHIQGIIQESTDEMRQLQDQMLQELEEKKQIVKSNQMELKAQLQDLVDTEKYLSLIEERNREIQKEKEKNEGHFGLPKEKSQFADVKAEIHINEDYFRNAGIPLEDEEDSKSGISVKEKPGRKIPEIQIPADEDLPLADLSEEVQKAMAEDLDAEYFSWKESEDGDESEEKNPSKRGIFKR